MRILFFGDIVGKVGRQIVVAKIDEIINKYRIDFVIANGENASHGKGLTENNFNELVNCGINAITLGNHYYNKDDINRYIDDAEELIRPANIIKRFGGVGTRVFDVDGVLIRVSNLLGTALMNEEVSNPYMCLKDIIDQSHENEIHIVDFHAEATSEKQCLGYAFDGLVSAIVGTHTHVQTRDAHILEGGTAYMSDIGMCGAYNGVLGFERNSVIKKTLFGEQSHFELLDKDDAIISAVVIDVDNETRKAKEIFPIYQIYKLEK